MRILLQLILFIGFAGFSQIEEEKLLKMYDGAFVMEFPDNTQTEQETLDFLNTALSAHGTDILYEGSKTKIQIGTNYDSRTKKKVLQFDFYTPNGLLYSARVQPEHVNTVFEKRALNGNLGLSLICAEGHSLNKFTTDKNSTYCDEVSFVLSTTDEEVRKIRKGVLHLLKLNNAPLLNQKFLKERNE